MKVKLDIPKSHDGLLRMHVATQDPRWKGPAHQHAELEMNLVLRGQMSLLADQRRHDLTAGAMVWLFPAQPHLIVDMSRDFQMIVAVFRQSLVRRVAVGCPSMKWLTRRKPGAEICRVLLGPALRRLLAEYESVQAVAGAAAQFNAGLAWLLVDGWRAFGEGRSLEDERGMDVHPGVARAARLLRADPGAWTLEQLAETTNLSPAWLSRTFHRQLGVQLRDFRNHQRIARFVALCGSRAEFGLTRLAVEAGFHSYSQCFRVCQQLYGCSPSDLAEREVIGRS